AGARARRRHRRDRAVLRPRNARRTTMAAQPSLERIGVGRRLLRHPHRVAGGQGDDRTEAPRRGFVRDPADRRLARTADGGRGRESESQGHRRRQLTGWQRTKERGRPGSCRPNGLADVVPTTKGVGSLPPPERYLRNGSDSGNDFPLETRLWNELV